MKSSVYDFFIDNFWCLSYLHKLVYCKSIIVIFFVGGDD